MLLKSDAYYVFIIWYFYAYKIKKKKWVIFFVIRFVLFGCRICCFCYCCNHEISQWNFIHKSNSATMKKNLERVKKGKIKWGKLRIKTLFIKTVPNSFISSTAGKTACNLTFDQYINKALIFFWNAYMIFQKLLLDFESFDWTNGIPILSRIVT